MFESYIAPSTIFMNVVIIEDEVELGQLIQIFLKKRILTEPASEVRTATSIQDGLRCIDEVHPDWVFLDNNLPDGRGLDLLAQIKSKDFAPKVVMMSAMTNIRQQALRQGADYFMDKPISFAEIKRIMDESGNKSDGYN